MGALRVCNSFILRPSAKHLWSLPVPDFRSRFSMVLTESKVTPTHSVDDGNPRQTCQKSASMGFKWTKRGRFCFLVGMLGSGGLTLQIISLTATWYVSSVELDTGADNVTTGENAVNGKYDRGTYLGYLVFGLFNGRTYLHTLVTYSEEKWSTFDYLYQVYNLGLHIVTVATGCLACVTIVITYSLGYGNIRCVPISPYRGTTGMYISNSLSFVLTGTMLATFLAQYYTALTDSAVSRPDAAASWTQQSIRVDTGFWEAVGAFGTVCATFVAIRLAVWAHESDPEITISQQYHQDRDKEDKVKSVGLQMMY